MLVYNKSLALSHATRLNSAHVIQMEVLASFLWDMCWLAVTALTGQALLEV
jgi:hypothetical protein